jgi:hypothetical protein
MQTFIVSPVNNCKNIFQPVSFKRNFVRSHDSGPFSTDSTDPTSEKSNDPVKLATLPMQLCVLPGVQNSYIIKKYYTLKVFNC